MSDHCIKFDDLDLKIGIPIWIILHRIRIPCMIVKVIIYEGGSSDEHMLDLSPKLLPI